MVLRYWRKIGEKISRILRLEILVWIKVNSEKWGTEELVGFSVEMLCEISP